jgi:6-methylsalicylate decarboxylase
MALNKSQYFGSCKHTLFSCSGCNTSSSRRNLLKGLGGISMLSAMGGIPAQLLAQNVTGLVDTHHHFYPPAYQKAWFDWEDQRKIPHFPQQERWTREGAIADMNKAGVQKAILSMASTPGVWFDLPLPKVVEMVRSVNDYGAEMVRDFKGRFGLFAALNMLDVPSTLKEIEYVFDVLKADGVGIQTNYGDKWPGHPDFAPIFEELNRRRALVYFHPLAASCCGRLNTGTFPAVIEVPHDTTRAVVNLLLSGTLAKFRDIRWLFSHAGGTIPMLAGRINFFHGNAKNAAMFAPNGVEAELRRLYYDTANATHPAPMAALLKLIPSTQVVYGSDYPYVAMDTQVTALSQLGLDVQVLQQIQQVNANRLLARN